MFLPIVKYRTQITGTAKKKNQGTLRGALQYVEINSSHKSIKTTPLLSLTLKQDGWGAG